MEIHNHNIKPNLIRPHPNSIFMHKNSFYGKSIHLRRGIRLMPTQNTRIANKTKRQASTHKTMTDSSKSLSISHHFKQSKSQQGEASQLERNSQTVNLNITNADFTNKYLADSFQKTKYIPKKKITIVNGHQIWIKHNQPKKMNSQQAGSANQYLKPRSSIQLILSKINANFKDKQRSKDIKQRSKTLPNNVEHDRQGKQTSLKATTIQCLGHEFQNQFLFTEYEDNEDLIVEIPSPQKSEVNLQQQYKQRPSRDIKVLILQKTNKSTNFRTKQQRLPNNDKQKPRKNIEETPIKVEIDNQFGPWSKKLKGNEEHEEIF